MRLIHVFFLSVSVVLSLGCSESSTVSSRKVLISHDVLVENLAPQFLDTLNLSQKNSETSCEQHIQKITCISSDENLGFDSQCSFDSVKPHMLDSLLKVYAELPEFHKKVFCHINRIQIHNRIFSIGYVTIIRSEDSDNIGSMMGLKIELLDPQYDDQSITWKEQLNFGLTDLNDPLRRPTDQGPFVDEEVSSSIPELFAVVMHEMNHLIDIYNGVNNDIDFESCTPNPGQEYLGRCLYNSGSFPSLSWGDYANLFLEMPPEDYIYEHPLPVWAEQYPLLSKLCYYWCEGKFISPQLINQTYEQLYSSPFLTGYSTSSEMEDFAEAAMIWVLSQTNRPLNYKISDSKRYLIYESDQHNKHEVVKKKFEWLNRFFSRENLKYQFD